MCVRFDHARFSCDQFLVFLPPTVHAAGREPHREARNQRLPCRAAKRVICIDVDEGCDGVSVSAKKARRKIRCILTPMAPPQRRLEQAKKMIDARDSEDAFLRPTHDQLADAYALLYPVQSAIPAPVTPPPHAPIMEKLPPTEWLPKLGGKLRGK